MVSSEKNRIDLALNSNDISTLKKLMSDSSFKVRRAIAKNRFTPANLLDALAFDPVENVSFKAVENQNCTIQRNFPNTHPCVCCELSEVKMVDCTGCAKLDLYNNK